VSRQQEGARIVEGRDMKICIFGAGAIGGYMGVKLAEAGADVSLVARGPHLAAMRERGLALVEEDRSVTVPVTASEDPAELGPQDYVIVTLKAHSVPPVVGRMQPLIGPETTVVSGVNGVPWWYFHKIGGDLEGTRLESVDPGNAQWDGFGPDRVLGCVVYPAAEVSEPGVIKHIEGNRFSLGEPDGSKSERALALSKALGAAGLKAPVRPRLRDEIWVKLWGNLSFNPISALTHATLDVLCTDPDTRGVARNMMLEAQEIAEKLGVKFPIDVERRIDGGRGRGRAPDLDVAGPRCRAADGDRRARGLRAGVGADHRHAHADHRYGLGPDPAAWQGGGALFVRGPHGHDP
jgi:2-dehydropantoate 2-reductase